MFYYSFLFLIYNKELNWKKLTHSQYYNSICSLTVVCLWILQFKSTFLENSSRIDRHFYQKPEKFVLPKARNFVSRGLHCKRSSAFKISGAAKCTKKWYSYNFRSAMSFKVCEAIIPKLSLKKKIFLRKSWKLILLLTGKLRVNCSFFKIDLNYF